MHRYKQWYSKHGCNADYAHGYCTLRNGGFAFLECISFCTFEQTMLIFDGQREETNRETNDCSSAWRIMILLDEYFCHVFLVGFAMFLVSAFWLMHFHSSSISKRLDLFFLAPGAQNPIKTSFVQTSFPRPL